MKSMKPTNKYKTAAGIIVSIFSLWIGACSDMHDSYQEYIEDGEIVYRAKADSVIIFPGRNRLQLKWWYADHKVTRSVVSWDGVQGSDSIEVELPGIQGEDTVTVELNDLEERSYNFEIVNHDDEGESSLPVTVLGTVYGSEYESSLLNRPITSAIGRYESGDSNAFLELGNSESSTIGTQVTYIDSNNSEQVVFVSPAESSVELPDIKPGSAIQYQTLYVPEPTAIDTFYAEAETKNVQYESP